MILSAITLMLADATLRTAVGRNQADTTYKIYPVACPQGEVAPYITCGLTGADPVLCKGVGGQPSEESFDVVVFCDDYAELDGIGRRVIQVLNNAVGGTIKRLTFLTHKDALDQSSKLMVRIITFGASV